MSKMNISKLSNEGIEDMFTEAFNEQIAKNNNIDEFECHCNREGVNSEDVRMEVLIVGMAGSPTVEDFKQNKLNKTGKVVVEQPGSGSLTFKLSPQESISMNSCEYQIVYKTV